MEEKAPGTPGRPSSTQSIVDAAVDSEPVAAPDEHEKLTITIVIPTFNRSKLLQRAVNSVRQQTYPNWKLVVVDNASGDDTPDVMAELARTDGRIRYHRHAENIGMLANWEFAISQVGTAHFSLLCDDDYLLPDFFEAAAREMTAHPELGLCFGVANIVNEEGKKISIAPNPMAPGYYPAGAGAAAMMTQQHPATPAIVFRTASFKAAGGFDRNSLFVADLDMILRVAFRYPVKYFEEESACYVVHAGNSFKDVSGWHPGLLNLVGNLKKLDQADPVYVRKVFRSFSKHAVMPLFGQFLRNPVGKFNLNILLSACRCAIEMRQVSNTLFDLTVAILKRVGSAIKWRLKVLWQVVGLAIKWRLKVLWQISSILISGYKQPRDHDAAPAKGIKGTTWLLAPLYWAGLTAFLVVYGLAEFLLVRPLAKGREFLSGRFRSSSRPD